MDTAYVIVLSFVLACVVGMERQLSKKPVGFAPYVFVTVLSTALTRIIIDIFPESTHVISGIITGIGFLGAGALIKYREQVFGFTTAAIIWAMAAFGIIIGFARLEIIGIVYGIIWAILVIDKMLETYGLGRHVKAVIIEARGLAHSLDIKKVIKKYNDSGEEESIEINFGKGIVEYKFLVPKSTDLDQMTNELSLLKGIRKIHFE
ncbi:MAG: MgtC/SapB family protein [Candidatus Micrarchaeota archaeon]